MQQGYQWKKQRVQVWRQTKSRSKQNMVEVIRHTSKAFTTSTVLYGSRSSQLSIVLINDQNLLRKSLVWNFNHYKEEGLGPFSNDANIVKHHVSKYC
jgi:hypothetical protein